VLVIHGVYHWRPRRIAFRNDYCRHCAAPRLAVQVRTFDVLHLFWLPLLPLGLWRRWRCSICGLDPHARTRTRRGFKVAGAVILALISVAAWVAPSETEPDQAVLWGMRLVTPLLLGLAIRSILGHRPEPALEGLLAGVVPFEGHACPLCGGELLSLPRLHCVRCGAERANARESAA
jgi:hypothetical protein